MLGFHDESGLSERPVVRRTWSLKGETPTLLGTGSWKRLSLSGVIIATPKGNRPKLFLRVFHGSMKGKHFVAYLKELKKHMRERKLLLIWDGLPAHRAKAVREYLESQKRWLKVVRLPAYAPELNPIEYLWSAMKTRDLAGLPQQGIDHLKDAVWRSKRKMNRNTTLLKGFLRASELY